MFQKFLSLKLFLISLLLLLLGGLCHAAALPFTGMVADYTNTLSQESIKDLYRVLDDYEQQSSHEIAVLIIPALDGSTIEEYALETGRAWKIGKKGINNGALLIVALKDRKVRIEVGYGLEGSLPDATCKKIIESTILPAFRNKNLSQGIRAGVQSMISYIDKGYCNKNTQKYFIPLWVSQAIEKYREQSILLMIWCVLTYLQNRQKTKEKQAYFLRYGHTRGFISSTRTFFSNGRTGGGGKSNGRTGGGGGFGGGGASGGW